MQQDHLRKQFHSVNNDLHKITILTGSLRKKINVEHVSSKSKEDLEKDVMNLLSSLSTIEKNVLSAGEYLQQIKNQIIKTDLGESHGI